VCTALLLLLLLLLSAAAPLVDHFNAIDLSDKLRILHNMFLSSEGKIRRGMFNCFLDNSIYTNVGMHNIKKIKWE
jgi:hypothetical protein